MSPAFIILAHKNPSQLGQLCDYLLENNCELFVHIDRKFRREFEGFRNKFGTRLKIFQHYSISWGSFAQVECTFFMLEQALAAGAFEYVSLISGQHLPLRPVQEFSEFLASRTPASFVEYYGLPAPEKLAGGGLDRVELFWVDTPVKKLADKLNVLIQLLQKITGIRRRPGISLFAGSNWWTIHRKAAEYICGYWRENPQFRNIFRHSRSADELVVQTILLNSSLQGSIVNDNLLFADWSEKMPHPRTLTQSDLFNLRSQKAFFARKFDEQVDSQIIKTILSGL